MRPLNIYMTGVGGQGIGLLSDVLALACVEAGYRVRGCDTHGLAQRGGTVVSHLRIGEPLFGPRVPPGQADLVIALERLEALRAVRAMLRAGGRLFYYDTAYQPIHVRLGQASYPGADEVASAAEALGAGLERVELPGLPDPRMQNVALLGRLASSGAIEGVTPAILEQVLGEAVPQKARDANLRIFREAMAAGR